MATITGINVVIGANLNGFDRAIATVTSGLNNVAGSVSKVASSIGSASTSAFSGFSSSLTKIGNNLSRLNQNIQDNKDNFKKWGDSIKGFGEGASKFISLPLAVVGAGALRAAGNMEALELGLKNTMGNAKLAGAELIKLEKVAANPGLGLEQVVQASNNLQIVGFSADRARQAIEVFGSAVANAGKGVPEFERATYALQQLRNTDMPLDEDLAILKDAIPQVVPLLNEAFGTARAEQLRTLGVTSDKLINTVIDGLAKLPPAVGGLNNSFTNFGDSTNKALSIVGKSMNTNFNIQGLIDRAGNALVGLANKFTALPGGVQKTIIIFGGLAAAVGPLAVGLGGIITILPIVSKGFSALSIVFTPLAAKIALVVGAIGVLALAAKSIYDAWEPIANFFSRIFNQVKLSVVQGILGVIESVEGFSSKIGVTFDDTKASLQSFANDTKKALDATPYVTLTGAIMTVGNAAKNNLSALNPFKDAITQTGTAAQETTDKVNALSKAKPPTLNPEQTKILAELKKELSGAEQAAAVFGTQSELAATKTGILTDGIQKLLDTGLKASSGVITNLSNQLKNLVSQDKLQFSGFDTIKLKAEVSQITIPQNAVNGLQQSATALNAVTGMADKSRSKFEALSNSVKISADNLQRLSLAGQQFGTYIDAGTQKAIDRMQQLTSSLNNAVQNAIGQTAQLAGQLIADLFTGNEEKEANKTIVSNANTRIETIKREIEAAKALQQQYQVAQRKAQLEGETAAVQKFGEAALGQTEKIEAFNQKLKEQQGILANAGGNTNKFENFFQGLLGVVSSFMQQFGTALVSAGAAALAFQSLMISPPLAIAAGVALIAASKVVANLLKKGPAGGNAPALATGTNYIPSDGLYRLHQGEAVVPKKFNESEFYGGAPREIIVQLTGAQIGFDALTFGVEKAFEQRQRMKGM